MVPSTRTLSRPSGVSVLGVLLLSHSVYAVVSNYPLSQPPADAIGPAVVLTLVYGEAGLGGILLAYRVSETRELDGLRRGAVVLLGGVAGPSVPLAWLTASPWWTGGGPPPYQISVLLALAAAFVVEVASWER
jgi:hypothetical protein